MKTCKQCGKEIEPHKKFCNRSCAASFNNKGVRRHGKEPSNCANCGNNLKLTARKYCNANCQQEHKWRERKKKYLREGKFPSTRQAKKYLKEVEGVKCSICGITEWQGQEVPLVCDHIDGNPDNDSIDNFRLVCGNCDMQLPTYKAKNTGNGRAWRRKRYKEGKSY